MRINNPSDKEVTLNYKGEPYTIGANSTKYFPEEVARHWVNVFQFMSINEDEIISKKEVEESKEVKETKKK